MMSACVMSCLLLNYSISPRRDTFISVSCINGQILFPAHSSIIRLGHRCISSTNSVVVTFFVCVLYNLDH